jgi:hypothetical protein
LSPLIGRKLFEWWSSISPVHSLFFFPARVTVSDVEEPDPHFLLRNCSGKKNMENMLEMVAVQVLQQGRKIELVKLWRRS